MGRAKRLKIEALERERLAALARGEDVPSIFGRPNAKRGKPGLLDEAWVHCSKCKHVVPIYMANEHLAKCSPGGVTCAKCKCLLHGPDYISHLTNCTGKAEIAEALGAEYTNKDQK